MLTAQKLHHNKQAQLQLFEHGTWLFKLEKEGVAFHLFGTQHDISLSVLPQRIQDRLLAANILFTETPRFNTPEEQFDEFRKIMGKFRCFEMDGIFGYNTLKKQIKKNINEILSQDPLGETLLSSSYEFKLWIIYCLLFVIKTGKEYSMGMDTELMTKFGSQKKFILSLETYCDRIEAYGFDKLSNEESLLLIEDLLNSEKDHQVKSSIDSSSKYYLAGDLREILKEGLADPKEFLICNARNKLWMRTILPHLEKSFGKTTSIAVGATHLLGEEGLLNLFAKEGFTIKRYSALCELEPFPIHKALPSENNDPSCGA